MRTLELITLTEQGFTKQIRDEIENLMYQAFYMLYILRNSITNRDNHLEKAYLLQKMVNENKFVFEIEIQNRHLYKYFECIYNFWQATEYYQGSFKSRGKFDLIQEIIDNESHKRKGELIQECTNSLNMMEQYLIACGQIIAKYNVEEIKKTGKYSNRL